jgi:selenide, water dikinase
MAEEEVRLTSLCAAAGCAAKMGHAELEQLLRPFQQIFPAGDWPDLLVGLETGDDAAAWRIDASRALIFTTDFFTPVVDDPYEYGAVAAANSISDVYAMGGEPFLALNVAGFPASLPPSAITRIFQGGGEKAREAGCVVAGGHTLITQEPIYGLAVVGFADPQRLLVKTGARPGDVLLLSKPLGVGVITTAIKKGIAAPEWVREALMSMKKLNRDASRILKAHGVAGCTDVTGFSLLGHALELAKKSGVGLRVCSADLAFLPGARESAAAGAFPGGTARNRRAFEARVRFAPGIPEEARQLLFSPETSGGLLAAVPAAHAEACLLALRGAGLPAFRVGEVDATLPPAGIEVV